MARLPITLACGDYDRTRALADGRGGVEGVDLTMLTLSPEETFFRMVRFEEFDVAELSLSTFVLTIQQDAPFVAIPVFPSRAFRHNGIYVHSGAGIESPGQLVGRRVGIAEYQLTANVWIRGILADFHNVPVNSVRYMTGGLHQPGREEKTAIPVLPEGIEIAGCPEGRTLSEMLVSGEIDALYTPRVPRPFLDHDPHVRRLFPDVREVEENYYRLTQIFPIMHVIVIRREVYQRNRWLASSLAKAFAQARDGPAVQPGARAGPVRRRGRAVRHEHLSLLLADDARGRRGRVHARRLRQVRHGLHPGRGGIRQRPGRAGQRPWSRLGREAPRPEDRQQRGYRARSDHLRDRGAEDPRLAPPGDRHRVRPAERGRAARELEAGGPERAGSRHVGNPRCRLRQGRDRRARQGELRGALRAGHLLRAAVRYRVGDVEGRAARVGKPGEEPGERRDRHLRRTAVRPYDDARAGHAGGAQRRPGHVQPLHQEDHAGHDHGQDLRPGQGRARRGQVHRLRGGDGAGLLRQVPQLRWPVGSGEPGDEPARQAGLGPGHRHRRGPLVPGKEIGRA